VLPPAWAAIVCTNPIEREPTITAKNTSIPKPVHRVGFIAALLVCVAVTRPVIGDVVVAR
jgi:hypothetical protein